MLKVKLKCKLLTPLVMHGADNKLELRATSIKGLLRFWWRAENCFRYESIEKMREAEVEIFGGSYKDEEGNEIHRKSKIKIQIINKNLNKKLASKDSWKEYQGIQYLLYSFRVYKDTKKYYDIDSEFDVVISTKESISLLQDVLKSFKNLMFFGGLGSRSRKGAGNFVVTEFKVINKFIGGKVLEENKLKKIKSLFDGNYSFENIERTFNSIKGYGSLKELISNICSWGEYSSIKQFNIPGEQNEPSPILDKMGEKYKEFRASKSKGELVGFGLPIKKLKKNYQNNTNRLASKIIFKVMEINPLDNEQEKEYIGYFVKLGGYCFDTKDKKKRKVSRNAENTLKEFMNSIERNGENE
ncbi:type III-B CRISPR module RAMP protein Cmr1 [Halonatronum saccharophilum]|uniref:type III-B CRISPR module RAMP protein Cmr1 n=1 Tax=Halonatronum saccharophilum TaxID=150060 RepID=UPI0004B87480|nr:type III-B CRISPR module RAMP protein Cmr1 [Halonatronum saccharophilum]